MTRTRTRAHLCPLLLPHQQFFANEALVFLSLDALQDIWHLKKSNQLYFFKPAVSIVTPGLARCLEANSFFFIHPFRKFHVLKKRNINAHIAQLSCTLVCLEPIALFWDNIRGFNLNPGRSVEDSFIEFYRPHPLPPSPRISTVGSTMCMWKVHVLHRMHYVNVSASCDYLFPFWMTVGSNASLI